MKDLFIKCFISIVYFFMFCCCNKNLPEGRSNSITEPEVLLKSKTKSSISFDVTNEDAYRFSLAHHPNGKISIEPLSSGEDTLVYVCNFEPEGWMIISGDRRVSPIIAESNEGRFEINDLPDGLAIWLDSIADDLLSLKKDLSFGENEHTDFWKFFSTDKAQSGQITKSDSEMKWYVIEYGPYETTIIEDNDIVPHLILTKWGQGSPWNSKCPIDLSTSDNNRCYLGCIATAVGQLLTFTHNNLGKPNDMYHLTSCSKSTVNGSTHDIGFTRGLKVIDSYRWDLMPADSNSLAIKIGFAGDLMLDIGNRFGMKYSGSGSGAKMSSSAMYNYYDINYSESSYNSSTVQLNLSDGLPVIVTAYSQKSGIIFPTYSRGHAWLIDGLHQTTRRYEFIKRFEYSENWYQYDECYDTFEEIQNVYGVSSPTDYYRFYITNNYNYLLMNWGYDGDYDNAYYSTLSDAAWNANSGNHLYKRKIYYDFN